MNTTTTVAVQLSKEEVLGRVATSNSFSKGEMLGNRLVIADARKNKRTQLAGFTGSNVGTLVDKVRSDHNAVVTDIKSRQSATQQTWTITLKAKVHKTEQAKLMDKAKRLQKELNKVEEAIETAQATTIETEMVTKA